MPLLLRSTLLLLPLSISFISMLMPYYAILRWLIFCWLRLIDAAMRAIADFAFHAALDTLRHAAMISCCCRHCCRRCCFRAIAFAFAFLSPWCCFLRLPCFSCWLIFISLHNNGDDVYRDIILLLIFSPLFSLCALFSSFIIIDYYRLVIFWWRLLLIRHYADFLHCFFLAPFAWFSRHFFRYKEADISLRQRHFRCWCFQLISFSMMLSLDASLLRLLYDIVLPCCFHYAYCHCISFITGHADFLFAIYFISLFTLFAIDIFALSPWCRYFDAMMIILLILSLLIIRNTLPPLWCHFHAAFFADDIFISTLSDCRHYFRFIFICFIIISAMPFSFLCCWAAHIFLPRRCRRRWLISSMLSSYAFLSWYFFRHFMIRCREITQFSLSLLPIDIFCWYFADACRFFSSRHADYLFSYIIDDYILSLMLMPIYFRFSFRHAIIYLLLIDIIFVDCCHFLLWYFSFFSPCFRSFRLIDGLCWHYLFSIAIFIAINIYDFCHDDADTLLSPLTLMIFLMLMLIRCHISSRFIFAMLSLLSPLSPYYAPCCWWFFFCCRFRWCRHLRWLFDMLLFALISDADAAIFAAAEAIIFFTPFSAATRRWLPLMLPFSLIADAALFSPLLILLMPLDFLLIFHDGWLLHALLLTL